MKQLIKKLKQLKSDGYEVVNITQLLNWMEEIKRDNRLKRASARNDG